MTLRNLTLLGAAGRAVAALTLGFAVTACTGTSGDSDKTETDTDTDSDSASDTDSDSDSDTTTSTYYDTSVIALTWEVSATVAGDQLTDGYIGLGFTQVKEPFIAPSWQETALCQGVQPLTGSAPPDGCPDCDWSFTVELGTAQDQGDYCGALSMAGSVALAGPYGFGFAPAYSGYYMDYNNAVLLYVDADSGWFAFMLDYPAANWFSTGGPDGVVAQRPVTDQNGYPYYYYYYAL